METHLKSDQYWKWRHKIEEMQHEETKLKNSRSLAALMDKEIEIQKLRLQLYKQQVIKQREDKVNEVKKEYEDLKRGLEEYLGYSLNNSTIDDSTFEVRSLEEVIVNK